MDSDAALRFDLTANQNEEFPAIVASPAGQPTGDALEISTSAVAIAGDEGEAQQEAGDDEDSEGGAEDDDEEEAEDEAEK